MIPIIEDMMGDVVAKMRNLANVDTPYYQYGHIAEISDILKNMEGDPVNRERKYPLIILRLDNPGEVEDEIVKWNLNIAICSYTNEGYRAHERLASVFKPVLFPLYDRFFEALTLSKHFFWDGKYPKHTKVDRYFWGTTSGFRNSKLIFDDPIDAIELINLKINSRIKTC
jgi:hypothetical protein